MLALDGDDAIYCADSPDWDFGMGAWTIECYVYMQGSNVSNGADFITHYDDHGSANQRSWGMKYTAANYLDFRYSTNGSSWVREMQFAWTPQLSTWYHIAMSKDDKGDVRAFIDGTQIGTTQNIGISTLF